jgi:hypothetical protein
MRTISLLAVYGAASTLLSCAESTPPTAPPGLEASAAAVNGGLSICSWGLGDFTGNGDLGYLSSVMNEDGTYQVNFYSTDATSFIDSKPTAGLATVYRDTLVVVNGSLPATEHSYSSGGTTAITLALDLRLVVTPRQGTGLHPVQGGQGGNAYTRFMGLSGTINGVQIVSGSGLSDVMGVGRFSHFSPPPQRATPFAWYGTNGSVQFCTR